MKKIAVLVRDRQEEAVRMAVGLSILDDKVSVFIMDRALETTDMIRQSIEALKELKVGIYTNVKDGEFDHMGIHDISIRLMDFDIVIPY